MGSSALRTAVVAVIAAVTLSSCQESPTGPAQSTAPSSPAPLPQSPNASLSPAPAAKVVAPPPAPAAATRGPQAVEAPSPGTQARGGRPRRARLSIPALGLHDLVVEPYPGKTDDARGTHIQDGGVAASPYGPHGGVGPGGLGNYQVTAHRTSSTQAFLMLPSLQVGQQAMVDVGAVRYVYEIRRTRETSFRSPRSLARAACCGAGAPRCTGDEGVSHAVHLRDSGGSRTRQLLG